MAEVKGYPLRLPADLVRRVQHLAIELGRTQAELYREAIEYYTNMLEAQEDEKRA